jgi:hypothetical protein
MQGVKFANIFYLSPDSSIPDEDRSTELQTVGEGIFNQFKANIGNKVALRCIIARVPTSMVEPMRFYSVNILGQNPADALPSSKVIVLRHYSNPFSRRNIGRYFFTGVHESAINQNRLTDAARTVWQNFINNLELTGIVTTNATWVYQHYSAAADTYSDIFQAQMVPTVKQLNGRQTDLCAF